MLLLGMLVWFVHVNLIPALKNCASQIHALSLLFKTRYLNASLKYSSFVHRLQACSESFLPFLVYIPPYLLLSMLSPAHMLSVLSLSPCPQHSLHLSYVLHSGGLYLLFSLSFFLSVSISLCRVSRRVSLPSLAYFSIHPYFQPETLPPLPPFSGSLVQT